jgi:hypothetical protein
LMEYCIHMDEDRQAHGIFQEINDDLQIHERMMCNGCISCGWFS